MLSSDTEEYVDLINISALSRFQISDSELHQLKRRTITVAACAAAISGAIWIVLAVVSPATWEGSGSTVSGFVAGFAMAAVACWGLSHLASRRRNLSVH